MKENFTLYPYNQSPVTVEATGNGRRWKARCPSHNPDKKPSLLINPDEGYFYCFACRFTGSLEEPKFKSSLKLEHWKFLASRGNRFTPKTTKKFNLRSEYFRDQEVIFFDYQGVKAYRGVDPDSNWRLLKGHTVRFIGDNEPKKLIVVEGLSDLMRANQEGLRGVLTSTGGAGALPNVRDREKFRNKDVSIIYDNDGAGIEGARRLAKDLKDVVHHYIKIIRLSVQKEGGDLTDYFNCGKAKENLLGLINDAPMAGFPNWKEKEKLREKCRKTIYSHKEIRPMTKSTLINVTNYFIEETGVYTGQYTATFGHLGDYFGFSPTGITNLLERYLKKWEIIDWRGEKGRSKSTVFTLKEYPVKPFRFREW
jgi:5S rRNA maturation endonuclease (ribonuclease M5)